MVNGIITQVPFWDPSLLRSPPKCALWLQQFIKEKVDILKKATV